MALFFSKYIPSSCTHLVAGSSQAGSNFLEKFMSCSLELTFVNLFTKKISSSHQEIFQEKALKGKYQETYFSNPSNRFTELIYFFLSAIAIIKKVVNEKDHTIWFYNVDMIDYLIAIPVLKYLLRRKINILLADYSPRKSFRFIWEKTTLKMANGIISLRELDKGIIPQKNIVLPGIYVPIQVKQKKQINTSAQNKEKINFLFSGKLSDKLGLSLVLNVFEKLPQVNLHVTGSGPLDELAKKYAKNYSNIKYHGFLSYEEYQELLANVDFGLNTRDPNEIANRFDFPSKIIEYFSHGKPVVSTIKYKGFELDEILYCEYSFNALCLLVSDIVENKYSDKIETTILSNKLEQQIGCNVWDEAIKRLNSN